MSDTNEDFSGMFGDEDTPEIAETAKEVIKEEEVKKEEAPKPATKKAKTKKVAEESVNPLAEVNEKLSQEVIDLNKLVKELEDERESFKDNIYIKLNELVSMFGEVEGEYGFAQTVTIENIFSYLKESIEYVRSKANKNASQGEVEDDGKPINWSESFTLDELFDMLQEKASSEFVTLLTEKARASLKGMKEPNSFIDKIISAAQEEVTGKIVAARKSMPKEPVIALLKDK